MEEPTNENDSLLVLKKDFPSLYKKVLGILISLNEKKLNPKQFSDALVSSLLLLEGDFKENKKVLYDLADGVKNNNMLIQQSLINERHNKAQIDFYNHKIDEYFKLYKEILLHKKQSISVKKSFLSIAQNRLTRLAIYNTIYDKRGYDPLGYDYSYLNDSGITATNETVCEVVLKNISEDKEYETILAQSLEIIAPIEMDSIESGIGNTEILNIESNEVGENFEIDTITNDIEGGGEEGLLGELFNLFS
jgi:hypothetical protein